MLWRDVLGKSTFEFIGVLFDSVPQRLKGPSYEAGTRLQAASGLHHLIGNHWHVLACILFAYTGYCITLLYRLRHWTEALRSHYGNIWKHIALLLP